MFFTPFLLSIFSAHPSWSFCTPELWSGTKNDDFMRWSLSDPKWSFTGQKVGKWAVLYAKMRPFEKKLSNFFLPIFSARPSLSFCTPELWSGTKNEDLQRWSPSDQKWSFTVRKVEKWAVLRAKMRPFEKKNWIFFFSKCRILVCKSAHFPTFRTVNDHFG